MKLTILLAAVLLAPSAAALSLTAPSAPPAALPNAGPEYGILNDYLTPFDDPAILHTHCLREGGDQPPKDWVQIGEIPATNALMRMHDANHSRDDDGAAGVSDRNDSDHYGVNFFAEHRMMISQYDDWRVANGHKPLAAWDPSQRISADFMYEPPTACEPRKTDDPAVPLPTWATIAGGATKDPLFNYTALCDFPSANRLGKSLGDYHGKVHSAVGGDMTNAMVSPRDPIFWAWHKWLDEIAAAWETCGHADDLAAELANMTMGQGAMPMPIAKASAPQESARAVPGLGAPAAIAVALLAAIAFGRRRA